MSEESTNPAVTQSVETPAPVQTGPEWFIDEQTPGQGSRPTWLPTKYKSAADLGKGYDELQTKLGAFTGAPDEYSLGNLEIDESQLVVQEIKAVAKELHMSQDGLQKFLGRIHAATETESEANLNDQVKKLGKDGERMLKEYNTWTKDYFKPEEVEVVKNWIKSSDDLVTFNRMMSNSNMSAVPTGGSMSLANNHESVVDLRAELVTNIKKFDSDKSYSSNWSKRMGAAVARENR